MFGPRHVNLSVAVWFVRATTKVIGLCALGGHTTVTVDPCVHCSVSADRKDEIISIGCGSDNGGVVMKGRQRDRLKRVRAKNVRGGGVDDLAVVHE